MEILKAGNRIEFMLRIKSTARLLELHPTNCHSHLQKLCGTYTNDAFVKEEAFYRAKRVFHEEMLMSFRDPGEHISRLWSPDRSGRDSW